ncbi:hypothetical protein DICPUDRAFT_45964 [Dictyostelium purpureum]|uniref:RING-type domain-containing protein n=1 Tax=Dictyostelium purpureum TaxID=5786 RepID=F0ZCS1_DICPU|nr:uncharacterized protein DICPUDRAFT_45964 [Dictyostelium purpureum]EGC38248.1 hypothetical protein DICPUDRAFT_45964 [Dictyostelium purpureum]|eukprot:XP_003285205.1 hypothetical protein DICPUDRAFT_45964 [Dictyostelium purpureum]
MMEEEEDNELNLNIPVIPLLEDIGCAVCLNIIESCSTLGCGHNFCFGCVSECVNRNHKCPLCSKPTTKENIVRNHQFDKLIKIIKFEKEKSKVVYYENLINNNNNSAKQITTTSNTASKTSVINFIDDSQQNNESNNNNSPVQNIFKKYLKNSLISFESYYQDLSKPFNENLKNLSNQTENTINTITSTVSSSELNAPLVEQIRREHQIKEDKLRKDFQESTKYLLSSLEDYLKKTAVPPSFINLYTTISIPERELAFDHIALKPTSLLPDIRETLIRHLNNRQEKFHFVSWTDDSHFVAIKPDSLKIDGQSNEIPLTDPLRPISFYNLPQGSKIVLRGGINLQGDAPKECFRSLYTAGTNQEMDYFRCSTCNLNWVCKNCSEYCHKGHEISIHLLNHIPTYGCCYDSKYKDCKLKVKK